jgi:hypothetical protein
VIYFERMLRRGELDPFAGAEQQPTVFQKSPVTLAQVRAIIEIAASE